MGTEVEFIDHSEFKFFARSVKAIIRTGEFTAFVNVICFSGPGETWRVESCELKNILNKEQHAARLNRY